MAAGRGTRLPRPEDVTARNVEDEANAREELAELSRDEGHQAATAPGGRGAPSSIANAAPDLRASTSARTRAAAGRAEHSKENIRDSSSSAQPAEERSRSANTRAKLSVAAGSDR